MQALGCRRIFRVLDSLGTVRIDASPGDHSEHSRSISAPSSGTSLIAFGWERLAIQTMHQNVHRATLSSPKTHLQSSKFILSKMVPGRLQLLYFCLAVQGLSNLCWSPQKDVLQDLICGRQCWIMAECIARKSDRLIFVLAVALAVPTAMQVLFRQMEMLWHR